MKARGLEILEHQERSLTEAEAKEFYSHSADEPYFDGLIKLMTSGPSHVLVITKTGTGRRRRRVCDVCARAACSVSRSHAKLILLICLSGTYVSNKLLVASKPIVLDKFSSPVYKHPRVVLTDKSCTVHVLCSTFNTVPCFVLADESSGKSIDVDQSPPPPPVTYREHFCLVSRLPCSSLNLAGCFHDCVRARVSI